MPAADREQWEYAARAGTTTQYGIPAPDGSDDIADKGLANCDGCGGKWDGRSKTAPVGEYPPNKWDLHDMHGNVWEWCLNEYDNPENTGTVGGKPRVMRGGSWNFNPGLARSSFRNWHFPGRRSHLFGFRVLCSSPMPR